MNWLVINIEIRLVLIVPKNVFQQEYLEKRAHPWLGLETLAIIISLPYALLMWG